MAVIVRQVNRSGSARPCLDRRTARRNTWFQAAPMRFFWHVLPLCVLGASEVFSGAEIGGRWRKGGYAHLRGAICLSFQSCVCMSCWNLPDICWDQRSSRCHLKRSLTCCLRPMARLFFEYVRASIPLLWLSPGSIFTKLATQITQLVTRFFRLDCYPPMRFCLILTSSRCRGARWLWNGLSAGICQLVAVQVFLLTATRPPSHQDVLRYLSLHLSRS
ncbi:hypothetical protein GGR56DRAFT_430977 [Xylariaceae sp. FL0804]|nr:hypothetical protein GGR56DRAFT_430977 [Xylariaceae sp. FL0804]